MFGIAGYNLPDSEALEGVLEAMGDRLWGSSDDKTMEHRPRTKDKRLETGYHEVLSLGRVNEES